MTIVKTRTLRKINKTIPDQVKSILQLVRTLLENMKVERYLIKVMATMKTPIEMRNPLRKKIVGLMKMARKARKKWKRTLRKIKMIQSPIL